MTVSESIISWLKTFSQENGPKRLDTDILRPGSEKYALAKEPIRNVKSYLSGKKEITEHYTFRACLPSIENKNCIDNNAFGEAISEWVIEQDKKGNYPKLEEGVVKKIDITTPFYLGATQENDSVYQMTIAIKYVKES